MKTHPIIRAVLLAIMIALLEVVPVCAAEPASNKPNIIFILADDLGIGSVGCYGADHFKTPNIDKLAESGIRFTHCYSSPLCGPSRALLLTGRYAFRTGMTSNQTGDLLKPANEIMIPTVLKQAGYVTAQVGKWAQLPLEPGDWGFDEYLRFQGSGKYWNTQEKGKFYTLNGKETRLLDGEYLPDKMHACAVDFITRHKDQPFFLYYPMSHVHAQILPTPDSKPGAKGRDVLYQDNIAYMDKLVGKLVAELDRLHLRENTLIVFTSDNGTARQYKEFCTIDGGKQLSGCKATMLECGALVPMVASWPGTMPAGKVSQSLVSFCDVLPTLAEVAGAKPPQGVTIDGRPFTSILKGNSDDHAMRDWIFVLLGHAWYDREANWKLNQSGELFDMKNAPLAETLVPGSTKDSEAIAARQRLQTVLDQLNPAAGKVDPDRAKKRKKELKRNKQTVKDAENANASDE